MKYLELEPGESVVKNTYVCPECGYIWKSVYSCACDEDCPQCGMTDISPINIEEA